MSEFRRLRCSCCSGRSSDWCGCYSGGLLLLLDGGWLLLCWSVVVGGGGRGVVVGSCSLLLCRHLGLLGGDGNVGVSLLMLRHGCELAIRNEEGERKERFALAAGQVEIQIQLSRPTGPLPSCRFRLPRLLGYITMASAETDSSDLTLGQLLARGIASATKVSDADSPNDPAIQVGSPRYDTLQQQLSANLPLPPTQQKLLQSALSDLTLCSSLISRLGILSPNETLEDINTRDLRCVLVDCLRGELEVLAKTKGGVERIGWLQRARVSQHFILVGAAVKMFADPRIYRITSATTSTWSTATRLYPRTSGARSPDLSIVLRTPPCGGSTRLHNTSWRGRSKESSR